MIFNEEPENWPGRKWICGGPLGTCSPWWKWYVSSPPVVASLVFDNFYTQMDLKCLLGVSAVRMQTSMNLKLIGKTTFYRWSEEESRCPVRSVKTTCPEIWTAVCVVVPLWPDVGETQVLSCHMCFSLALLSPNHFKIFQNVQKRKVPRQSFNGSWGQGKPPLTSLNTRKDCHWKKTMLKKVQSHMTMKEVKPYVTSLSSSV